MKRTVEKLDGTGRRFAVVVARFNEAVTSRLLEGAVEGLRRHGVRAEDVEILSVPGAFEIPLTVRELATRGGVDGIVCLGAVVRGETPHFDFVAGEAARGIAAAMEATGVPMSFGVLTTDTIEQALARSGGAVGNRGYDAALAALEMVSLLRMIRGLVPQKDGS
jgi:6,7-dimethyl-8-ribityllumazine synthase